jgi:hypothetical protein
MSNYTKENLITTPATSVPAGTLAIKVGDEIFTAGNVTIGTDTSDATATAGDIAQGKTAYVKGKKVIGAATGGVDFYKCSSVDTVAKTWDGYKAVLTDGGYTFEESVTEDLPFGGCYTPAPGFIYDSGATVLLSTLWSGLPQPADYDIYASFVTPAAEKGGLLTTERQTVEYGIKKNGVLGAEINNGRVSIPWNMSEDFTFSVRYKPLSGGENYYGGPLVRVGDDGGDTLYSIWVNMEWDMCMMRIEYGSGGTEPFDVDTNHHIYTLVKSGDELKLYVDTELRTTDNHTCNVKYTSHIYVGSMGHYLANGHYSNLRIYSRALTAEEIAAIVQQSANN